MNTLRPTCIALQEGCRGFEEGAEELYKNVSWIRGYWSQGEVGYAGMVFSGTPEIEGTPDKVYKVMRHR